MRELHARRAPCTTTRGGACHPNLIWKFTRLTACCTKEFSRTGAPPATGRKTRSRSHQNRFAATLPRVRRGSSEDCELRLAARKAVLLTETDGHQRASGPPAKEPSLNWHLAPTLRFQRKTGSGEGSRHRLIESKSWVPFADRRGAQPGVEWIAPRSGCVLVVSVPLAAARKPLSCGGATTQWRYGRLSPARRHSDIVLKKQNDLSAGALDESVVGVPPGPTGRNTLSMWAYVTFVDCSFSIRGIELFLCEWEG